MRNSLKTAGLQLQQLLPKSRAEKTKQLLSPVAIVATHESAQKALAFGLMWQSIVDEKSRQVAVQTARLRGATHTTSQGLQNGFAHVPQNAISPGEKLYAASRIAARSCGGDALFLLQLAEDMHWLAVVRNGQPSAQDQLYATAEEACEAAQEIYESLQSDGVHLKVYSDASHCGFVSSVHYSLMALMEAIDESSEPLAAIQARKVPVSAVVGLCVLALGFVGLKGYEHYQAKKRARAIALSNASEVNAAKAWEEAVSEWSYTVVSPRGEGINQARNVLSRNTPAVWNGWILEQAGCAATQVNPASAPGGSSKRVWTCNARYAPGPAASVARELEATKPEGWDMTYPNLTLALATFTFTEVTKGLNTAKVNTVAHHQVETISTLQPFRPALSEGIGFVFEPVAIQAPVDSKGAPIDPPPEVPKFLRLNLQVKGPLRSLDAVVASPADIDWSELKITSIQPYPDSQLESGLTTSAVTAEAKGTLYAKQ